VKKRFFLLLCVMLAVSLSPVVPVASAAIAEQIPAVIEVVKSVNFRQAPSTDGKQIRLLKAGERLEVLGRPSANWYQVKDKSGKTGYVSSSTTYVKTVETRTFSEPNGLIKQSVNFRKAPTTEGERIRYLQKGEYVRITEKVNDYWYKIEDAYGVTGYVSTNAKYIDSMFEAELEPEEELYLGEPNGAVVRSVNFREKPSTSGKVIRLLKTGEPLWVLDRPNNNWYQVMDKNGVTGFVSQSYIETSYKEPWKSMPSGDIVEKAIAVGLTYLGTPYEFGSSRNDTSTFDCSDFIRQIFLESVQLTLPSNSRSQAEFVRKLHNDVVVTDWRNLQRGDLMFFMSYKGYKASAYAGIDRMAETVTHVCIYLGDGKLLHTYSVNSGGVRIDDIAGSQWELRFLYGGSAVK